MGNAGFKMLVLLEIFLLLIHCQVFCDEISDDDELEIITGHGGTITTSVDNDVLVLTSENFDLQVAKDIILVEFYAPWCGHCQTLAPEYAKAASILKDNDPPVLLAKIDATVETDIATRYGVTGFPTLFVFRKGEKFTYDGPRSALGIVDHMKQQADPDWKPPPEAVLTLTSDNFTDAVEEADLILVEFYAPWCGHCKHLAPQYERAAQALKGLSKPILLAKIDGTAEKKLADKYGASGWPTLMIFRRGTKYEYNGPREESGIIDYMKEQAKPPSQEIVSSKALTKSLSKTDATIVGFFSSQIQPLFEQFLQTAYRLRDKFSFHHSFSDTIAKDFEVAQNRIVLFMPKLFTSDYEPTKRQFSKADGKVNEITSFIRTNCVPLVGERSAKTSFKYENRYPMVIVYYDVDFSFDHRKQTQMIRKEVTEVAKDFKGEITFVIANEEAYEDEIASLGLDDSGEDVNVGYYKSLKIRYAMPPTEDFSSEELRDFIKQVHDGEIQPHIKSLPEPKSNKGPVITVVGSSFKSLVTDNNKDVLLEFYAPWCGHCKKLEPLYKKLAKQFEHDNNVLIAKMDATANDYPDTFDVKGFPTIYYIPAHDKNNVMLYEGERTLKDLTDFIDEQLEKRTRKDEL